MFPIVIPAFPFNAELILTAASGILVPMATMVSPTTSWGIPNRSAIPDAPSTNQSAPFTSIKKPNTSNNTCKIISIPAFRVPWKCPVLYRRFFYIEKERDFHRTQIMR